MKPLLALALFAAALSVRAQTNTITCPCDDAWEDTNFFHHPKCWTPTPWKEMPPQPTNSLWHWEHFPATNLVCFDFRPGSSLPPRPGTNLWVLQWSTVDTITYYVERGIDLGNGQIDWWLIDVIDGSARGGWVKVNLWDDCWPSYGYFRIRFDCWLWTECEFGHRWQ